MTSLGYFSLCTPGSSLPLQIRGEILHYFYELKDFAPTRLEMRETTTPKRTLTTTARRLERKAHLTQIAGTCKVSFT